MRNLVLVGFLFTILVSCSAQLPPGTQTPAAPTAAVTETVPDNDNILFWTPAQTQVGFRRIENVFPVHRVQRGPIVKPLPRAAGPELDVRFTYNGQTFDTDSYMAQYRVSGIAVIRNGKVLLERYGLGRKPDDRWISFSVTKSLTSTLIGAAIQDGYIRSLDDTLDTYVEEMKGSVYAGVSIRHLLTMSSGVRWNEDYTDPKSDVARAGREMFPGENSPILAYMRRLDRALPAGAQFNYSTGETDLAGYVLSRAVGMTMAEYLSRKIWAPYGMEQDAVWVTDTSGHERGGCCLNMTLRDYARIGLFMLEDGAGVTPPGWVEDATSAHLPVGGDGDGDYGYFWWVNGDTFDALGIFGQMIHVDPGRDLVIAINSAWPAATGPELSAARAAFVSAAAAASDAR